MKIAVVYYSFDGNCALIAEKLCKSANADIVRLTLKDGKKRRGFFKFAWGVGMILSNKKPALNPVDFDPSLYDLIIIGSPVWAGTFAPPLKTFCSNTKISGKKLAFYVCFGGDAGKSLINLKTLFSGNDFIGEIGFKNPASGNTNEIQKLTDEWIRQLTINN